MMSVSLSDSLQNASYLATATATATPSRQSVKEMLLARSDGKTRKEGEGSRSVGSDTSSHCLNSTSRKYLRQVMRMRFRRAAHLSMHGTACGVCGH